MNPEAFARQQREFRTLHRREYLWIGRKMEEERGRLGPSIPGLKRKKYTRLLLVLKEACDLIRPLIQRVYADINKSSHRLGAIFKQKADKSKFTILDGLVQHLIVSDLLEDGMNFEGYVGEEDSSRVHLNSVPYTVEDLEVPVELNAEINRICNEIRQKLRPKVDKKAYKNVLVFVDPIDGTRMFLDNKGEQCCIMVGLVVEGKAVAGLLYRPLSREVGEYALGCSLEGTAFDNLEKDFSSTVPRFLTAPRDMSGFIVSLADELCMKRVTYGSVGNKVLNLLQGKGACYIQDRGSFRWDTCAPEALIAAYGGCLVRLSTFIASGKLETYRYKKTGYGSMNPDLDFIFKYDKTLWPKFSRYNGDPAESKPKSRITPETAHLVKAYSNLCGFICLPKSSLENIEHYREAIMKSYQKSPPALT